MSLVAVVVALALMLSCSDQDIQAPQSKVDLEHLPDDGGGGQPFQDIETVRFRMVPDSNRSNRWDLWVDIPWGVNVSGAQVVLEYTALSAHGSSYLDDGRGIWEQLPEGWTSGSLWDDDNGTFYRAIYIPTVWHGVRHYLPPGSYQMANDMVVSGPWSWYAESFPVGSPCNSRDVLTTAWREEFPGTNSPCAGHSSGRDGPPGYEYHYWNKAGGEREMILDPRRADINPDNDDAQWPTPTTFSGEAAAIVTQRCVGCHRIQNPAKGLVLDMLRAPQTDDERLRWTVDLERETAGVSQLTEEERLVLLEYGAPWTHPVTPASVSFSTADPVRWPGVRYEDGGLPGSGWRGENGGMTGDLDGSAYWFWSRQFPGQSIYVIMGQVRHAEDTGIIFGAQAFEPPAGGARRYYELRFSSTVGVLQYRFDEVLVPIETFPWQLPEGHLVDFEISTIPIPGGTQIRVWAATVDGAVLIDGAWDVEHDARGKVGLFDEGGGSPWVEMTMQAAVR